MLFALNYYNEQEFKKYTDGFRFNEKKRLKERTFKILVNQESVKDVAVEFGVTPAAVYEHAKKVDLYIRQKVQQETGCDINYSISNAVMVSALMPKQIAPQIQKLLDLISMALQGSSLPSNVSSKKIVKK